MRAVQASDYAIPEFQGLWKLIFVHGRWSYIRISEMILYFFYKNMLFTIPQFYFSFLCGFSGQSVFDDWYITFYNMIFTALPLVMRAIFEQDIYYKQRKVATEKGPEFSSIVGVRPLVKKYYPALYYLGQKNEIFNHQNFYLSVLQGIVHGVLIFCVTLYSMPYAGLNSNGYNSDMWYFSIAMYTAVILIVDLKLATFTRYWTTLSAAAIVITSLGFYFAYVWIANSVSSFNVYETADSLFSSQQFYLSVLLSVGVVFTVDMTYVFLRSEYKATVSDLFNRILSMRKENDESVFKVLIDKEKVQIELVNTNGNIEELSALKSPQSPGEISTTNRLMKIETHI